MTWYRRREARLYPWETRTQPGWSPVQRNAHVLTTMRWTLDTGNPIVFAIMREAIAPRAMRLGDYIAAAWVKHLTTNGG